MSAQHRGYAGDMALWDSVRAFFKREATDVREGFGNLRDKLDAELTRRETELEATPSERLDMIREDIESDGSVFDEIEDKIDARLSGGESLEELRRHLDGVEDQSVEDDAGDVDSVDGDVPSGSSDPIAGEPDRPPEEPVE